MAAWGALWWGLSLCSVSCSAGDVLYSGDDLLTVAGLPLDLPVRWEGG